MENTQHKHFKRSRSEIAVITIRFSSNPIAIHR